MADKAPSANVLAVDLAAQTKKNRRKPFPKYRERPDLCDHGCGRLALFSSTERVWRCEENVWKCPAVAKRRSMENNPFYGHKFTAEMRAKALHSRGDKLKGSGNGMFGMKRPEHTKKKMGATRVVRGVAKGPRNPNWRGGVSIKSRSERYTDMTSARYKHWRVAVFERDNYTCLECGARNGQGRKVTLNADHIKPYAGFPELRYNVDNGRTLCVACHRKTYKDNWALLKELRLQST